MGVLDTIETTASPSRRTVDIVLNASLDDEWRALRGQLPDAAEKDVKHASLAKPGSESAEGPARPATTAVVQRMEEIRAQVEASTVYFTFERLEWQERVALQVAHPPRQGNTLDAAQGLNVATYTPALIRRACVGGRDHGEPEDALTEIPEASWATLLGMPASKDKPAIKGALNYAQVERLYAAAKSVNDGLAQVPTSARFLLETPDSEASLAQPSPGPDRPRSASKAGSRRTSRRTSTTTPGGSSEA